MDINGWVNAAVPINNKLYHATWFIHQAVMTASKPVIHCGLCLLVVITAWLIIQVAWDNLLMGCILAADPGFVSIYQKYIYRYYNIPSSL